MTTPHLEALAEVKRALHRLSIDRGYMLAEVETIFLQGGRSIQFLGQPREGEVRAVVTFERIKPGKG